MSNMHDSPSTYNVFQKLGHPGRWSAVETVTVGNISFTGSAVWGGVLVSSSAAVGEQLSQIIQLSEGGTVVANSLSKGIVHELSVQNVSGSAASTGIVYVLKRNG